MKIWELRKFGLSALAQTERPVPAPGPHELLVRIGAVSLNYRDRLVIEGVFIPDLALPFVPASDGAGEVVAVGEGVSRFRVGDRVMGIYIPGWIDGDGSGPEGDYVSLGGPLPGVWRNTWSSTNRRWSRRRLRAATGRGGWRARDRDIEQGREVGACQSAGRGGRRQLRPSP
jgi:Alcohol dehydrogenase GroES-like domain